jgi:hypothetical protein
VTLKNEIVSLTLECDKCAMSVLEWAIINPASPTSTSTSPEISDVDCLEVNEWFEPIRFTCKIGRLGKCQSCKKGVFKIWEEQMGRIPKWCNLKIMDHWL